MNHNPKTKHLERTKWKPGICPNPLGRPKKLTTTLGESGTVREEIINLVIDIAYKTNDELKAIENNPMQPAIVKIIARSFYRGAYYQNGHYKHIADLMSYVIGKPAQFIATQKHIIHTQVKGNK